MMSTMLAHLGRDRTSSPTKVHGVGIVSDVEWLWRVWMKVVGRFACLCVRVCASYFGVSEWVGDTFPVFSLDIFPFCLDW